MTDLITQNQKRWDNCKINASKLSTFDAVVKRLTSPDAVAHYKAVEKRTGVPWWFTAVVHEREASQSWRANLAQGDPWNRRSTHVPAGRGPFNSWEDAAVDALVNCAPYAARNKDWSPGAALAMLEKYNGLGYAKKGIPSPYNWAGTNQYVKGKYVADGVFDPNAVDKQLGCAGLLQRMNVFSKTSVPVIAGTTVAGVGAVAATSGHPWGQYAAIACFALVAVGLAVYWYKNRKKNNVSVA